MTDEDYLRIAYREARRSGDLSTQNGAILVDPRTGEVVAYGRNDIPEGCCDSPERRQAPLKYPWVHHAEEWAVSDAARKGVATEGLVMYATWAACAECAKCIVSAGISKLVRHDPPQHAHPKWADSIAIGDEMFREAGIELIDVKGELGEEVLFNGQLTRM